MPPVPNAAKNGRPEDQTDQLSRLPEEALSRRARAFAEATSKKPGKQHVYGAIKKERT